MKTAASPKGLGLRVVAALWGVVPPLLAAGMSPLHGIAAGPVRSAQDAVTIVVGEDRLVSSGIDDRPIVESHLATHPLDATHLLATAMVPTTTLGEPGEGLTDASRCATWLSRDAGETWTRRDHAVPGCGDPWVTITPDGTAVFTALGNAGMPVYRSTDGGDTWEPLPVPLGVGHDHPTLVVDTTAGRLGGSVYLVSSRGGLNRDRQFRWTVYVARSRDEGASFPFVGQAIPSNLSFEAQLPAVLSDGTLIVPFTDHHTIEGRRIEVGARRSWLLRSVDGGRTFTEPLFITDDCDGRGGWPSLVATADDHLFFVCVAADLRGVLVFRSTDRGESWNEGVRADSGGDDAHTRVPTVAVSPEGLIGVSWYERRADPARECQHIHFAVSTDDGLSFASDTRVSAQPSCPDASHNGWTAERFPGGGDYAGLVATGGRRFRLVWSDAREGLFRLRTVEVEVSEPRATPR